MINVSNFSIRKKRIWNSNFIQHFQLKSRKIHSKDTNIFFCLCKIYIFLEIYFCQKNFEIKIELSKSISLQL